MHFRGALLLLLSLATISLAHSSDPIPGESLPSIVPAEPIKAPADTRSYAIRSSRGWRRKVGKAAGHQQLKRRTGKGVRRLSADH
ncbi:hypothetical protein RQP46_007291 [Phenoliferia psychrophenolica]